jgi:hypothetical protein
MRGGGRLVVEGGVAAMEKFELVRSADPTKSVWDVGGI